MGICMGWITIQPNINTHLPTISIQHEFDDWKSNITPDPLKQYKTKCGVSKTIRYDTKWHAQQRARLRHNRSDLNDHLYHMNRINSPIGNNCTDNVNETTEHALIHCIKHQSIRDKYINAVHSIIRSQQLNTAMLLWSDTWNITHNKQLALKQILGEVISEIMKNRVSYIAFDIQYTNKYIQSNGITTTYPQIISSINSINQY